MIIILLKTLSILVSFAITIIIVQAILSWLIAFNIISLSNNILNAIWQSLELLTEPVYSRVRRFIPSAGILDLTPMAVLIGLLIIEQAIIPGIAQAYLT